MTTETIGRAKVVYNGERSCIYIKLNLEDSFDAVPRPVAHVGNEKYIKSLWNNIKKHRDKYLENPKTINSILWK